MTYVDATSDRLPNSDPLPRTRTALGVAAGAAGAASGYVLVLEADATSVRLPNSDSLPRTRTALGVAAVAAAAAAGYVLVLDADRGTPIPNAITLS